MIFLAKSWSYSPTNTHFFGGVEPLGDADEEHCRMLDASQIWPQFWHPYLETSSPPCAPPPRLDHKRHFEWKQLLDVLCFHTLNLAGSLWTEQRVCVCLWERWAAYGNVTCATRGWELLSAKRDKQDKCFKTLPVSYLDAKMCFWTTVKFNTVFLVWTEISISNRRRAAPLATLEIVSKWPLWNTR